MSPQKPETHKPHAVRQLKSNQSGQYNYLYHTPTWRRIRKAQLAREPMCRDCKKGGKITVATVCDHIVPHRGNIKLFFKGPFQSLCEHCHNRNKQIYEKSGKVVKHIGVDGYPIETGKL